jgi:hypothetical protein
MGFTLTPRSIPQVKHRPAPVKLPDDGRCRI